MEFNENLFYKQRKLLDTSHFITHKFRDKSLKFFKKNEDVNSKTRNCPISINQSLKFNSNEKPLIRLVLAPTRERDAKFSKIDLIHQSLTHGNTPTKELTKKKSGIDNINIDICCNLKRKVNLPLFSNYQLIATKSKIDKLIYEKSNKLSEMGKSKYIQSKNISINYTQYLKPILVPEIKKKISLNTNKFHLIALTKDEFMVFRQKYYKTNEVK